MAEAKKTRSKSNFFSLLDWKRDTKKKTLGKDEREGGKITPLSLSDERRTNIASVSSVNEEFRDIRPAGVVAKLMGLDSMPFFTSDASSSSRSFRSDNSQYSPQVHSHVHRMREGYFLECLEPRHYVNRYQNQESLKSSYVPMRIRSAKQKNEAMKMPSPLRKESYDTVKKNAVKPKDVALSKSFENFKRKEFGGKSPPRAKSDDVMKKNSEKQKASMRKGNNSSGKAMPNKPAKKLESRTKKVFADPDRQKNNSRSKKPHKSNPSGIVAIKKEEKDLRCNPVSHPPNLMNSMDIVSFTFSSPIKSKSIEGATRIDEDGLIAFMERRFEDRLQCDSPSTEIPMVVDGSSLDSDAVQSSGLVISLGSNGGTATEEDSSWEMGYVKAAVSNAQKVFDELATGETTTLDWSSSEESGRKVMLDCSSEIIEGMCGEVCFVGMKNAEMLLERKEFAAERIYKEIMNWKSMGKLMLDQVIYMDMSAKYGKWHDFQIEAFEEGLHVVSLLFHSLLDELLSDFSAMPKN